MATLQLTHTPILNSSAQLLILPVNTAGVVLDSVLIRAKTLFPDNYQRYYRACRDGSLNVGSCLLHKRALEQAGLGISSNGNQPVYIANLVVSDHPYHPVRLRGLNSALIDLQQQLVPLIRYQGIRRAALLARPLIFHDSQNNANANDDSANTTTKVVHLDWYADVSPLLTQQLQDVPKLHINIHLPKDITI
ncbi:macro domain-containing protein [Psychrobacter aquaticus]|uniref:Uncharacterized protein n=1 Tax=Psychrobacter aquaticus CMS 56 TaxID=1354303 RepID=U4TAK1_9GAMM|nr:hypothetical protein [Psychrobacter aquaticus]ERL55744.1 hypothetical protein M917_1481 [Psychrobacter aquaticus CMS 56]